MEAAKQAELMERAKNKEEYQRVLCIWLKALGYNSGDIATITGLQRGYVRVIQSRYRRDGEESLKTAPSGGRRRYNLTIGQEEELLRPFRRYSRIRPLDVRAVRRSYEAKVGHAVPASTVYRMLWRHGFKRRRKKP